jgi:hypothetical protein
MTSGDQKCLSLPVVLNGTDSTWNAQIQTIVYLSIHNLLTSSKWKETNQQRNPNERNLANVSHEFERENIDLNRGQQTKQKHLNLDRPVFECQI